MPSNNMKYPENGIPDYAVRDLFKACQMAYRKHHCNDESIGLEELSEALYIALTNSVGDTKFVEWLTPHLCSKCNGTGEVVVFRPDPEIVYCTCETGVELGLEQQECLGDMGL